MRRKPYLSLLLAVILLGGMLALFPKLWMGLLIILIALVAVQVALVRRSLYTLPGGHTQVDVPLPRKVPPAPASGVASEPTPPAEPAPVASSGDAAAHTPGQEVAEPATAPVPESSAAQPAANIDTELFSRFRLHLERAESEPGEPAPPAPASPELPEAGEVQDRVEISRSARQGAGARRGTASKPRAGRSAPASEPEGPDLFADLRPAPPPVPPPDPAQAARMPAPGPAKPPQPAPPAEAAAAEPAPVPERTDPAAPPRPALPRPAMAVHPAGPSGDEVSAALADGRGDAPGLADEAATLLHLAEDAAAREDWEGLRAGLDNYLAHLAEAPRLIQWRARRLQVRMAIHDDDVNRALQGFEDLLGTGHRPTADEVPALLDGLLAGAEARTAASLRVSMLVRILAVFRQARDQSAMDRCYGWIEEAQEQVGDERRLLQYLKNHLEIRKVLGDLPGQLELIDQLGNRCYRLGLTDDAKTYYGMGLRLRAQAELPDRTAAQPGEEEPTGEPTQQPGGAVREG